MTSPAVKEILERERAAQTAEGPSTAETLKTLGRIEEKNVSGLKSRLPKNRLLEIPDEAIKENPGYHLRWVSLREDQKVDVRKGDGYEIVPMDKGGKTIGKELVLMRVPISIAKERVKEQHALNDEKLKAHRNEMQRAAEEGVRELRDAGGMSVNVSRVLVDESEQ